MPANTRAFDISKMSDYIQRFETYIKKTDSCWLWTGVIGANGYGINTVQARKLGKIAHRVSYELFVTKIPVGFQIDHLCRVRTCVNPAHLEAVTPQENTLRSSNPAAQNARKSHCNNGHELTSDNVYLRKDRIGRGCLTCRYNSVKKYQENKRSSS